MLTYESIRLVMSNEKTSKKLTPLPDGFFSQAKVYLEQKAKLNTKEDAWELESAKRLITDLLEIRERKIIEGALFFVRSGAKPENMTQEEFEFFNSQVELLRDWQDKKKNMIEGRTEKKPAVAFLEPVPRFVGIDMKNYGPYKQGDVATLPKENAELLLKKGIAKGMDI